MTWDKEVDWLVVGSGAAGMTSALRAVDLGARVLVVEKSFRALAAPPQCPAVRFGCLRTPAWPGSESRIRTPGIALSGTHHRWSRTDCTAHSLRGRGIADGRVPGNPQPRRVRSGSEPTVITTPRRRRQTRGAHHRADRIRCLASRRRAHAAAPRLRASSSVAVPEHEGRRDSDDAAWRTATPAAGRPACRRLLPEPACSLAAGAGNTNYTLGAALIARLRLRCWIVRCRCGSFAAARAGTRKRGSSPVR